jgi:hypothetical protein
VSEVWPIASLRKKESQISFRRLLQVDPGFKPDGVVTASVSLPQAHYTKEVDWRKFIDRALPAMRAIPGGQT